MRDIQFSGFAKMLCDELEQTDALRYARSNWIDLDRKEVQGIIAQRAYDLIEHALESCLISERAYSLVRHYSPNGNIDAHEIERHFDRSELLQDISDMSQWPEASPRKQPVSHMKETANIQMNALIAEKVMGWQWVPFDFYDVSMKNQLWLLPNAESINKITCGEWTWYLDEEEIYPECSLFPLPHFDKRILPIWLPNYSKSIDDAWDIVTLDKWDCVKIIHSKMPCLPDHLQEVECHIKFAGMAYIAFGKMAPEAICLAALKAVGIVI